jgi:hypothetical protein
LGPPSGGPGRGNADGGDELTKAPVLAAGVEDRLDVQVNQSIRPLGDGLLEQIAGGGAIVQTGEYQRA